MCSATSRVGRHERDARQRPTVATRKRRSVRSIGDMTVCVVDPHDPDRDEADRAGEVHGRRAGVRARDRGRSRRIWLSTSRISGVAAIANTPSAKVSTGRCTSGEPLAHGRRSAGSSSNVEAEDLLERRDACGRTSSTATRPAELARDRRERRVLEPAGGDPVRERRRVEVDVERVAVRRHPRETWTPIDAILRGGCSSQTRSGPRSASPRCRAARASGSAPPRGRGSTASRPGRAGSGRGSGSRRAARARGRWTCRRGRSRRPRRRRLRGRAARPPRCAGRA